MIYLDQGATSFPKPTEVIEAVQKSLLVPASPGRSGHKGALDASRTIFKCRKAVCRLFGVEDNNRVVFTANISWALNIAINGFKWQKGDHIISSPLEHNSASRPLRRLVAEKGISWEQVPLTSEGLIKAEDFQKLLRPETKLVVVNHASNVTGALAPVLEIKKAIGSVPLLLDCAQSAGAVSLTEIGPQVDILAFTGHKALLGPTGTGGLYVRPGLDLLPLAVGGSGSRSESLEHPDFMPDMLEVGTPNTHGLAGLLAGINFVLDQGVDNIRAHELLLLEKFLKGLKALPQIKILPPEGISQRTATVSILMDNMSSSDLSARLEADYGIYTRAGLHCAPLGHQALNTFPGGATRFSFAYANTIQEVETAIKALTAIIQNHVS